jgi:hypothetical protein
LRLKSLTSRRFHAGASSRSSISALNSATSPVWIAVVHGGVEAERQHLGVGGGLVGAAE